MRVDVVTAVPLFMIALVSCGTQPEAPVARGTPPRSKDVFETRLAGAKAGSIATGQTVTGTIEATDPTLPSDGSHYDLWTFPAGDCERLTVNLSSNEFDSYVLIGKVEATTDEEGTRGSDIRILSESSGATGGRSVRLSFDAPQAGDYVVVVNTRSFGQTGGYELSIASGGNPATRYGGGGDPSGRYALLVGLADYPGDSNDLVGPEQDLESMYSLLTGTYGFPTKNVVLLRNDGATRCEIAAAFQRHLGQVGKDGVAVFYFSGHGTQPEQNLGLMPPIDIEPDGTDEALMAYDSILLDDELGFLADNLRSDNVLLILDSCFSGRASRGGQAMPKRVPFPQLKGKLQLPGSYLVKAEAPYTKTAVAGSFDRPEPDRHVLLTACSEDELSYTAPDWPDGGAPGSVFTHFLTSRLKDAGDAVTFADVMDEVRKRSAEFTSDRGKYESPQTPQLEGRRGTEPVKRYLRVR